MRLRKDNLQKPVYFSPQDENRIYRILNHKWFPVGMFVICFMIPFIVHADHLLAGEGLVAGDGLISLYDLAYLGQSIREFDFPLWTPYLAVGKPYADAITLNALYPVGWICSLFPGITQFYAYLGIHYAIGGTFLYLYLRKINCDEVACLAASIIYLFSVHMGGPRKEHTSLIISALWVPVILYFIESYFCNQKFKWLLCASAAMALQFLGGFLQYVIYSDIFVFFYLFLSGIHRKISVKKMLTHDSSWLAAYFGLIAVGVIPMMKFLSRISVSGGTGMSKEVFSSFSLHPVKLLMSIFPQIFGPDAWAPLIEKNFSSGLDAELLLGAPCITLVFVGISLARKNFHAFFATLAGLCAFTYACLGQSEILTNIFYQIPVLNMFRVPSRVLFLFTLCSIILLTIALDYLIKAQGSVKRFYVFNGIVTIFMTAVFIGYALYDGAYEGVEKQGLSKVFFLPFLSLAFYLVSFYFGIGKKERGKLSPLMRRRCICGILVVITVVQLWPYYTYTYYSRYESYFEYPKETISTKDRRGKVWYTDNVSASSCNQALCTETPTLNAYTNYNLPNLYKLLYGIINAPMNSSGMYYTFADQNNILENKKALLSMLGIQYIVSSPDRQVEQCEEIASYNIEKEMSYFPTSSFQLAEDFQYALIPVTLEADSWYRISLTIKAQRPGDQFYVDFYGENYDFPEQEVWFGFKEGITEYQAILPSDACDDIPNILLRVIALTDQEIELSQVRIQKIDPTFKCSYELISEKENCRIFENADAKPLFYPSQKVISITEKEKDELYLNVNSFDVLSTSYILNGKGNCDFSDVDVQISDIHLSNNRASALAAADKEFFINMSQTYYPGWNAYVDGQKTDIYEVNGIIQGTFVPSGNHVVEFRYQPVIFYVGLFVSFLTILLCIYVSYRMDKKEGTKK